MIRRHIRPSFIDNDTDYRYGDETTGAEFVAYIIQDPDSPPDDFADELQEDAWETFNNGDVYGVVIAGPDDGHMESLWGIYDDHYSPWRHDSYTCQVAKDMLHSAVNTYRSSALWVTI